MKSSLRVHGALLFVALIYAANYSLSKDVMPRYLSPFGIVTLRVLSATVFFTVVKFFVAPHDAIRGRADNIRSILCGICGIGVNQLLFFAGLNLTAPITASLVQTFSPIVVVVASVFLLKERLSWPRVLGIAIGAAGAAFLILSRPAPAVAALYPQGTLGNVFILINATVFGLYLVLVAPLMRSYHPFTVLARVFLVGAIVAVPFGWRDALGADYAHFPTKIWLEVGYMIVFLTILAYLLNNWALKYAAPALLGAYIYIQPVLAAAIAVVLGKDVMTWGKAGQALIIFLGVWLVGRRGKTVAPVEPVLD